MLSFFAIATLFGLGYAQDQLATYDPFSVSARCPLPCDSDRSTWVAYHDLRDLDVCNKTVLLDLNVYYKVENMDSLFAMRSCASESSSPGKFMRFMRRQMLVPPSASRNSTKSPFDSRNQTADIEILRGNWSNGTHGDSNAAAADDASILAAAAALANHLASEESGDTSTLFSRSGNAMIGVYAGSQIDMTSVGPIIQEFAKRASANTANQTAAQLCHPGLLGSQIFGIFLDTRGDLGAARDAVRGWRDAECIPNSMGESEIWRNAPIATIPGQDVLVGPDTSNDEHVDKRATCSYTQVQAGDGCWALAQRCKITQDQLVQYSGNPNLCSSLQAGQYVCCSVGTLPDFSPQPNADGTCKTMTFNGDFCSVIAQKNHMTVDQIEQRNKKTWGWAGCNFLQPGQVFCLSTGTPPMPAPVAGYVCGPQVNGTKKPSNMDTLASLNPCPLNACCDVWGQCGTTSEFCTISPADTGAPGTTKAGANSCISNCGMDIVNNKSPPATVRKVGYFEAFNKQRPCLHMRPGQINTKQYTHVHFAFAGITDDFTVDLTGQEDMFSEFKALTGVKRIMSFGGWSFSTDSDTFPIFREGVTAAQRQSFASAVVQFLTDNNLDGLDFDWEYPGAPDIPGIPPGSPNDGANYLAFLKLVRNSLPAGKSLSIAAPASFWYLKGFPIADISNVVDYIVYMTYDMHGQWDYGNKWSDPGCSNGDCLRSHVNMTEIVNSLTMITKAGVQASKILIGMALYGRSFQMTQPTCRTPDCHYTGPVSGAEPGRCTQTRGYISNFEIREIISTKTGVQQYSDNDGDYVIYDTNNWVSWMTKSSYDARTALFSALNFGGFADWAIDLDADYGPNDGPGGGDSGSGPVLVDPSIYTSKNPTIQCYPECTFVFPPMTLPTPTTISIPPETITFEENWSTTVTVSGAVITTSAAMITSTVISIPPVTTNVISLWDVTWTGSTLPGSTYGIITLTMSVPVPAATFTFTSTDDTSSTAFALFTYSPGPWPPLPLTTTLPGLGNPTGLPIPSPPPPPPGFPPTVSVKTGSPGPTCTAHCGKPCQHNCSPGHSHCVGICGCIGPFCPSAPGCALCPPSNCLGIGCSDGGFGGGGPPGSPNNPNDPSSSCRTRTTVSSCEVDCSVITYPGTTTTTCNDPKCSRTITACSATDTTTTTTTTLSCPLHDSSYPTPDPNVPVIIGDGGFGGSVLDPGDFTSMAPKPSSTPSSPSNTPVDPNPPLPTFTPGGGNPYCFRDHNTNGQYHKFGESAGDSNIAAVCNTGDDLPPSNTYGFAVLGTDNLLVSVTWATDQTGCPAKQNVPLRDWCTDTFREIISTCDKDIVTDTYGGAFVEMNNNYGCVRWWIGTQQTTNAGLLSFNLPAGSNGTLITNPTQLQAIQAKLDQIEPDLPRMVRPGPVTSNGTMLI